MNAGMNIKLKKCSFFTSRNDYSGHIIASGEIHVATKTTEALNALQYPTTLSGLQSFNDL